MGYWRQNEQGVSFASAKNHVELVWGDAPADIMGPAIDRICQVFYRDKKRLPIEEEIQAGLLFSLPHALEKAREKYNV